MKAFLRCIALSAVFSVSPAQALSIISVEDYWYEYVWETCVPAIMLGGDVDDRYEKAISSRIEDGLLYETWRPDAYPVVMETWAKQSGTDGGVDRVVGCRVKSIGAPVLWEDNEPYEWSSRRIANLFERQVQEMLDEGIAVEKSQRTSSSMMRSHRVIVCKAPSLDQAVSIRFDPMWEGDDVVFEARLIKRPYFDCRGRS